MNFGDTATSSGSRQANSTRTGVKTAYQAIYSMGTELNLYDFVLAEAAKNSADEISRLKELIVSIRLGRVAVKKLCLDEAHLYHRAINSHYRAILNVSGPPVRLDLWRLTPEQRQNLKSRGYTDADLDRCHFEMLAKTKRWSPTLPTEYPKEHSKKFMAFLANIRPASPRNWTIQWAKWFRWSEGGSAIGRVSVRELVAEYTKALVEQYIPNRIRKLEEMQSAYDCVSSRLIPQEGEELPARTVGLGARPSDWYYDREKIQHSGVYVDVNDYVPSRALRQAAHEILGLADAQIDERLGFYRTHAKQRIQDVAQHELALSRFLFRESSVPKSKIGCARVLKVEDPVACTNRRAFLIVGSSEESAPQTNDSTRIWNADPEETGYLTPLERSLIAAMNGDLTSPQFGAVVMEFARTKFVEEFDAAREKRLVTAFREKLLQHRKGNVVRSNGVHDDDILVFQSLWLYVGKVPSSPKGRDPTAQEIEDIVNAQSGVKMEDFNWEDYI